MADASGTPRKRGPVAGVREARLMNTLLQPHREALGALHERIALARMRAARDAGMELRESLKAAQAAFESDVTGLPDPHGATGDLRRSYGRAMQALQEF
jgi:hypothetical protein